MGPLDLGSPHSVVECRLWPLNRGLVRGHLGQPDKLVVVWTRRSRRKSSKAHSWQPGIKNPYRGVVVWPVPENIEITVTLFKVVHCLPVCLSACLSACLCVCVSHTLVPPLCITWFILFSPLDFLSQRK
ncbi:EH domain-binding protein 1 [Liparis tanakae]|uniref:EH domain-binding protein 1 n=1 Tax=Liparis tanakae TaxID=230148 RepID=A0A4Z2EFZ0_9TELE|nr:EH domain-binding protein 1 [Liparis tanakae]